MKGTHREAALGMFLAGRSVRDVSAYYGVNKTTIEHLLRATLQQLVVMTVRHAPKEDEVKAV